MLGRPYLIEVMLIQNEVADEHGSEGHNTLSLRKAKCAQLKLIRDEIKNLQNIHQRSWCKRLRNDTFVALVKI